MALALFRGDSISEYHSFFARTTKDPRCAITSITRKSIGARNSLSLSRFLPLSLFLPLPHAYITRAVSRVYTIYTHTYARTSRATDRARASKSNASASDTPGSRSFLRSYSHTSSSRLVLSACPSLPGLSLSVHLVISLLPPSPPDTRSFTIARSHSPRLSLSRSPILICVRLPRVSSLRRSVGPQRGSLFVRCSLISPFAFTSSSSRGYKSSDLSRSPSFSNVRRLSSIRPCLCRQSMPRRLLQFDLIRSFPAIQVYTE